MKNSNYVIRESNFELLRIVAMFLVLVVHADYLSLGRPTQIEIMQEPISSIGRIFFQAMSIACVNIFILISGWFGIKPSIKSFSNFIFQCLFFYIGIYLVGIASGFATFSIKGLVRSFALIKWNWFIYSYILLYILAPILNSYINNTPKKQIRNTIICFYIFQTIFAFLFRTVSFFENGYSTISFIGLYMLARYIKLFPNKYTTLSIKNDFLIISFFITLIATIEFILISYNAPEHYKYNNYINPFVILVALYTLLLFSKLKFHSKFINWIASSCFAVYLIHINPLILDKYLHGTKFIYNNTNGFTYLLTISLALIIIFIFAIFLDKIRILVWNLFWKNIERTNIYQMNFNKNYKDL